MLTEGLVSMTTKSSKQVESSPVDVSAACNQSPVEKIAWRINDKQDPLPRRRNHWKLEHTLSFLPRTWTEPSATDIRPDTWRPDIHEFSEHTSLLSFASDGRLWRTGAGHSRRIEDLKQFIF